MSSFYESRMEIVLMNIAVVQLREVAPNNYFQLQLSFSLVDDSFLSSHF